MSPQGQQARAQTCLLLRPRYSGPCRPLPSAQSQAGDRGGGPRPAAATRAAGTNWNESLSPRLSNRHPSELQGTGKAEAPAVGAARSVWEPPGYCYIGGPRQTEDGHGATAPPPAGRPRGADMATAASLNELHVVGRKHAKVAVGPVAAPPAFVDHLDARDEVLGVKGDLGLIRWKEGSPKLRREPRDPAPARPFRHGAGTFPYAPFPRGPRSGPVPAKDWRRHSLPHSCPLPEATPRATAQPHLQARQRGWHRGSPVDEERPGTHTEACPLPLSLL